MMSGVDWVVRCVRDMYRFFNLLMDMCRFFSMLMIWVIVELVFVDRILSLYWGKI